MLKAYFDKLIDRCKEQIQAYYGDKLISLAVFGSVASKSMVSGSDLDLFICAEGLPNGARARLKGFQENVEDKIGKSLFREGVATCLSTVIKTPEELLAGGLIFIDMTENVEILFDKSDTLRKYLEGLKIKMGKLGSKKIKIGSTWFWDLIPDYKKVKEVLL